MSDILPIRLECKSNLIPNNGMKRSIPKARTLYYNGNEDIFADTTPIDYKSSSVTDNNGDDQILPPLQCCICKKLLNNEQEEEEHDLVCK